MKAFSPAPAVFAGGLKLTGQQPNTDTLRRGFSGYDLAGGEARMEGDGFLTTVGFTAHMEEGGGVGWKCKKKQANKNLKKPS